jgi:hypothetical protein
MRERWIGLHSQTDWTAALASIPHTFAHTWDYCAAMQASASGAVWLYEVETDAGRVVCPLVERSFGGAVDVVTPYGFSGFVSQDPVDGPTVSTAFRRSASERGYVSGYLVQNPALASSIRFPPTETSQDKSVYVWDLGPPVEALYADLHANRRRQLRDHERVASRLVTDRGRLAAFLIDSHPDFFTRRQATSTHGLTAASISRLARLDNVHIVGVEDDGQLTAASMFGHAPSGGDYLYNVSTPAGREHSAALVWSGALHLKSMGVPHLNLGGGLVEGDGIADFKRRFGARRLPAPVLKQVYDGSAYVDLCRRVGVDPNDRAGYFPAYRRSTPRQCSAPRQL